MLEFFKSLSICSFQYLFFQNIIKSMGHASGCAKLIYFVSSINRKCVCDQKKTIPHNC